MKKIVTVTEVSGEGLDALLGEKVILLCMNYHYAGTLEGVNDTYVKLAADDAALVYETGAWTDRAWKDAQETGQAIYVQRTAIEAFMRGK
jgi:hypothetical protein